MNELLFRQDRNIGGEIGICHLPIAGSSGMNEVVVILLRLRESVADLPCTEGIAVIPIKVKVIVGMIMIL